MPLLAGIGAILIVFGILGIGAAGMMLVTGQPAALTVFVAAGGINALIGGLVLQALERLLRAAEQIAANTEPLLALAGRRESVAQPAREDPDSETGEVVIVRTETWRGRAINILSDDSIEAETATGWRRFPDRRAFDDYIG